MSRSMRLLGQFGSLSDRQRKGFCKMLTTQYDSVILVEILYPVLQALLDAGLSDLRWKTVQKVIEMRVAAYRRTYCSAPKLVIMDTESRGFGALRLDPKALVRADRYQSDGRLARVFACYRLTVRAAA